MPSPSILDVLASLETYLDPAVRDPAVLDGPRIEAH